jgi:hypothetical protein
MDSLRLSVAWLVVATILVGCGGSTGPKTVAVTGNITLDGTPLSEGSINFLPADGVGVPSGAKIANGTYRAEVPLGDKRVEIRSPQVVGQKVAYEGDPNSPKIDLFEERIPARYNSQTELKATIAATNKPVNFDLESPKK